MWHTRNHEESKDYRHCGPRFGGRSCPFQSGGKIRFALLLFGKQAFGSIAAGVAGKTVDAQPAEQGLRLDMPVAGSALHARPLSPRLVTSTSGAVFAPLLEG